MIKKKRKIFGVFALATLAIGLMLPFGENIAEISRDATTHAIVEDSNNSDGLSYSGGGISGQTAANRGGSRRAEDTVDTIDVGTTTWVQAFPDYYFRIHVALQLRVFNGTTAGYNDTTMSETTFTNDQVTRLNDVTEITMSWNGITNASGLRHMPNLTLIRFDYCSLTSIDISHNLLLTSVSLQSNKLTSIDVSNNTLLQYLLISGNSLIDSLDISNLSDLETLSVNSTNIVSLDLTTCPNLKKLYGSSMSLLSSVDLSLSTEIEEIDLSYDSSLSTIDVSACENLKKLSVYATVMTSIDLSNNLLLTQFNANYSAIESIDVSLNTALVQLDLSSMTIESLDLSNNTELIHLNISSNPQLGTISLANNVKLQTLNYRSCQLTSIDLSTNVELKTIYLSTNKFTSLDLSTNTLLEYVDVSNNLLTSLVTTNNTKIYNLDASNNQITSLDLSTNIALVYLRLSKNKLSTLSVSTNVLLYEVMMANNDLSQMDFSMCPNLYYLDVSYNKLNSLNLLNLIKLRTLEAAYNELTSFDFTSNSALHSLSISFNQLTELTIDNNPSLYSISCNNNELTSLDFSGTSNPSYVYCQNNFLTEINLENCNRLSYFAGGNNKLTEIDFRDCIGLTYVDVCFNQLSTLDFTLCPDVSTIRCNNNNLTSITYHPYLKNKLADFQFNFNPNLNFDLSDFNRLSSYVTISYSSGGDFTSVSRFSVTGDAANGEMPGWLELSVPTGSMQYSRTKGVYYVTTNQYTNFTVYRRIPELNKTITTGGNGLGYYGGVMNDQGIYLTKALISNVSDDGVITLPEMTATYDYDTKVVAPRGMLRPATQETIITVDGTIATITGNYTTIKFDNSINNENIVQAPSMTYENDRTILFDLKTFEIVKPRFDLNYFVTDENGDPQGGSVSGGEIGEYVEGTPFDLVATPDENYGFVGWYEDDVLLSRDPEFNLDLYRNYNLEANFKYVSPYEQCNLDYSISGGGEFVNTSHRAGTYDKNTTTVTLEVTEATEDDLFVGWYEGDQLVSSSREYVFVLTHHTNLVAKFKTKAEPPKEDFTLRYQTIIQDTGVSGGGTITGTLEGTYETGDEINITANPDHGYTFSSWHDSAGNFLSFDENYITTITGNIDLIVYFKVNNVGVNEYTLYYETEEAARGSVSGSNRGVYDSGTELNVVATPAAGHKFIAWYNKVGDTYELVSWDEDYTFNITRDLDLVAMFKTTTETDHKFSYEVIGNGSISGKLQGIYNTNSLLNVTATAELGSKFVGWYDESDNLLSRELTYEFNIHEDTHLVARFKINPGLFQDDYQLGYRVQHQDGVTPDSGTISGPIEGIYDEGTTIQLEAIANPGFTFVGWYNDGKLISRNAIFKTNIAEDLHLVAMFKDEATLPVYDCEFSAVAGDNGTISSTHNDGLYDSGTSITVSATADQNYQFIGWYEGDLLVSRDKLYTFSLDHDTHLVARFKKITVGVSDYLLDYKSSDTNIGTVSGNLPSGTYDAGELISITATIIDTDYKFVAWLDENDKLVSWSQTYNFNIYKDTNLTAYFKLIPEPPIQDYRFTFEIIGGGEIISTHTDGIYNENTHITLQQPPEQDYRIVSWSVNGEVIPGFTDNTYEFDLVDDTHIVIVFEIAIYDIVVQIEGHGDVLGGGTYREGDTVTLTAIAHEDSSFLYYWDPISQNPITDENVYVINDLQSAYTIVAVFVKDKYYVNLEASQGGDATGGGLYNEGATANLLASAHEGYEFVGWYQEDGSIMSVAPGYAIENISEDITLRAVFREITTVYYSINIIVDGPGTYQFMGGIGAGPFPAGQNVIIRALPGYMAWLNGWWDTATGSHLNSSTDYIIYNIQKDMNITLRFGSSGSSDMWRVTTSYNNGGWVSNGTTYVTKGESVTLTASPYGNYTFGGWFDAETQQNLLCEELSYTFTPTEDTYLYAHFVTNFAQIRANATEGGYAGIIYQNANYGNSVTVTLGSTIELYASPNNGYSFVGWYDMEKQTFLSFDSNYQVDNIREDLTVYAMFKPIAVEIKHRVSISVNGFGNVTGSGYYVSGSEVTLTAVPGNDTVEFFGWYDRNNNLLTTNLIYTIDSITRNMEFYARFSPDVPEGNVYCRATYIGPGGDAYGEYNGALGGTVYFYAYPDSGFKFLGWFDEEDNLVSMDRDYRFTATRDLVYTAKFEQSYCYIESQVIGMGTLKINGKVVDEDFWDDDSNYQFDIGSDVTMEAIPNPGYEFYNWLEMTYDEVNDIQLINILPEDASFVFEDIQTHKFIIAVFVEAAGEYYDVQGSADGEGSVSGSGSYLAGSSAILVATPDEGYRFDGWEDSEGNVVETRYFYIVEDVQEDHYLTAKFVEDLIIPDPPIPTYDVTSKVIGSGSVSGTGTFQENIDVILQAAPAEGYSFTGWFDETGNFLGNKSYYIIEGLSEDTEITARFDLIIPPTEYTVHVITEGDGTVEGDGTHFMGQNVILRATPDAGQEFVGWYDEENEIISKNEQYIIYNLTENREIRAVFREIPQPSEYTVTVHSSLGGSVTGDGTYDPGDLVTLQATPEEGYKFIGWYDMDGELIKDSRELLIEDIDSDHELQAIFAPRDNNGYFDVEVDVKGDGSVTGEGTYADGDLVVLLATPAALNEFLGWFSQDGTLLSEDPYYIIDGISEDHYIVAKFQEYDVPPVGVPYDVDVVISGDGSVYGGGTYNEGSNLVLVATPDDGHKFDGWYIEGVEVGTDLYYEILDLSADIEIEAIFSPIVPLMYNIKITIEGQGSVIGAGDHLAGSDIALVAQPAQDWVFVGWFQESDDANISITNPHVIYGISADWEIVAKFEPYVADVYYDVSVNKVGKGNILGQGSYLAGTSPVVSATPATNWVFDGWKIDGSADIVSTDASITINNIDNDHSYIAIFRQVAFVVDLMAGPVAGGTLSGAGTYNPGENVTVSATANDGYKFVGWYDLNGQIVTARSVYEIKDIQQDVALRAIFSINPHVGYYEVITDIEGQGSADGQGLYAEGERVILIATPEDGHAFAGWYDLYGNLVDENYFHIIQDIDQDYELVAKFETEDNPPLLTYTVETSVDGVGGSTIGSGTYAAGSDVLVLATPDAGYEFVHWIVNETDTIYTDYFLIEDIASNHEAVAVFKSLTEPVTYEVSVDVTSVGGHVEGAGIHNEGQNVVLEAIADEDYEFVGWYDEEGNLVSENPLYVIYNIHEDVTLEAVFQEVQIPIITTYDVIVNIIGEGGAVVGAGTYNEGSNVTLDATVNDGYKLVGWYDSEGRLLGEDLEYIINNLEEDVTLTAKFAVIEPGGNNIAAAILWAILLTSLLLIVGAAIIIIVVVTNINRKREEMEKEDDLNL